MASGYSPLFVLFPEIQTPFLDKNQVEFAHCPAVWMLVTTLIDSPVTFQKIREGRHRHVDI
ncbi:hypothetical protein D3C80_2082880 [compost metagenome]